MLALIGVIVVVATLFQFAESFDDKNFGDLARALLLIFWLPLFAIPFVYLFSLYAYYELAFVRMGRRRDPPGSSWKRKLGLLVTLRLNVADVGGFVGGWPSRLAETTSVRDAMRVASQYKAMRRGKEEEHKPEAPVS
jgi:hypothetical protein